MVSRLPGKTLPSAVSSTVPVQYGCTCSHTSYIVRVVVAIGSGRQLTEVGNSQSCMVCDALQVEGVGVVKSYSVGSFFGELALQHSIADGDDGSSRRTGAPCCHIPSVICCQKTMHH